MNVKKSFSTMTTAVLLVAAMAVASASVTVDSETGLGFVGKGDVQLAFGWNDPQLQVKAVGVSFTYDSTDNYSAVCNWTTGEGTRGEQIHNVSHTRSTAVNSTVAYEARKNSQNKITGFNLTGFGDTTVSGHAIPVVGEACPGNPGTDGTWTSVELVSSSGGLVVHWGGISVPLQ